MRSRAAVFAPAALAIVISLLLILYSLFAAKNGHHPGTNTGLPAGRPPRREGGEEEGGGIFKTLGTIALACAAVSYSWFRLKKRMASKTMLVRKVGKWVYKLHNYTGYAALLAVIIHGTYFLIEKTGERNVKTGLAAFVMLLAVAVYGIWLSKSKGKLVRKTHFVMTNLFLIVMLLHASGQVILIAGCTMFAWAVLWVVERYPQVSESRTQN